MSNFSEIRKNRLKKLEAIKNAGFSAYPIKTKRTHEITEILKDFDNFCRLKKEVILAGRIRSIREHGGSTFLHIEDGKAKIQCYFKKDRLGEDSYQFFLDNFDIGDFIEVRGELFKTRKGEKTLEVLGFKMLAKALLPLPEKWHGLKDIEERYRKRYLDLIFNPEVKKKFIIRSKIIKEIRSFLNEHDFLEVETPILQSIYGGAKARPFKTHLNALNLDLYLRIAPELYLKRLLVGGFEKVYELGRMFRNEGIDKSHNPDFTMLEFYWAYADYKDLMKFTEKMFEDLLKKIFGGLKIKYQGKEIDFSTPWQRVEFTQVLRKYTKINLDEIHILALKKEAKKLGIKVEETDDKSKVADEIYKKVCLPNIWNPTFIIHHPLGAFPLAKQLEPTKNDILNKPKLANFQLITAGWELINAFSELNDPLEQRKRFEQQEKLYKKGLQEAQRIDKDFLTALEYGMPPSAGLGMGIDRLVALLTDSHSLREVILFPTMKPKDNPKHGTQDAKSKRKT